MLSRTGVVWKSQLYLEINFRLTVNKGSWCLEISALPGNKNTDQPSRKADVVWKSQLYLEIKSQTSYIINNSYSLQISVETEIYKLRIAVKMTALIWKLQVSLETKYASIYNMRVGSSYLEIIIKHILKTL